MFQMDRIAGLILGCALSGGAFAQMASPPPAAKLTGPASGLVLTLSRVDSSANSDSATLQVCLKNHPALACIPLRYTMKNEGKKTILHWYSSCAGDEPGFEVRKDDGSWAQLVRNTGEVPLCSRNMLEVQALRPGQSVIGTVRLGDAALNLDTAFPPDDGFIHTNKGYLLLAGPGPRTIRARWALLGCVASDALKPGDTLNPFAPGAQCLDGTSPDPLQPWLLQSNELRLETESKP